MKLFLNVVILGAIIINAHASETAIDVLKPVIPADDPFVWMEEVDGEKAMEWVTRQNAATTRVMEKHPGFQEVYDKTLEILNSKERIAYPAIRGEFIYNFWKDEAHPRGVWRRTKAENYFSAEPEWETLIDVNALSEKEGEAWAFKGVDALPPSFDRYLVRLSRGGGDAVVIREFDVTRKEFVTEDLFRLEEAKSDTVWFDRDTLLVGTDFGEGSLTSSGYPRLVKQWKRGTPLSEATLLFEGKPSDVSVYAFVQFTPERKYTLLSRGISFYETEFHALEHGRLIKLDLPLDVEVTGFFKNHVLVNPKRNWTVAGQTIPGGALVAVAYDPLLQGQHEIMTLFTPTERDSLGGVSTTRDQVIVNVFKGGRYNELWSHTLAKEKWSSAKVATPEQGTLSVVTADDYSDRFFFTHESPLSPDALYYSPATGAEMVKAKSLPEFFDAADYRIVYHEAISKDGTEVPYSIVMPKAAKLDGTNPTLLYGYGGFEISLRPRYSPLMGSTWLANGGVFVVANIRGGGEFGPAWHEAAKKENKQRSYDDFIAVSEDLIRRGYCSAKTLGVQGGSNGGLLVGVVATQRPDLYNAVVCDVPLLDMKRYNKLLAGASWMAEFGDPDQPEEWAYIKKYSPYQNLSKDGTYPKIFFKTTTRDDRVHPAHARKMAARMEQFGHPFFYFENTEGGHGAGVTNEQRALMKTLERIYLLKMLK